MYPSIPARLKDHTNNYIDLWLLFDHRRQREYDIRRGTFTLKVISNINNRIPLHPTWTCDPNSTQRKYLSLQCVSTYTYRDSYSLHVYTCGWLHHLSRAPLKCSRSTSKKKVVNSADVIALQEPACWERNCRGRERGGRGGERRRGEQGVVGGREERGGKHR